MLCLVFRFWHTNLLFFRFIHRSILDLSVICCPSTPVTVSLVSVRSALAGTCFSRSIEIIDPESVTKGPIPSMSILGELSVCLYVVTRLILWDFLGLAVILFTLGLLFRFLFSHFFGFLLSLLIALTWSLVSLKSDSLSELLSVSLSVSLSESPIALIASSSSESYSESES